MQFLGTFKPPVVAALPAAGDVGRLVRLSTDNHIYHDNGSSWDDLTATGGAGGSFLSGEATIDFGLQDDQTAVATVANAVITAANIKSASFVPKVSADHDIEDFALEGMQFQIENIVDNTSFDIRAYTAPHNETFGQWTVNYDVGY